MNTYYRSHEQGGINGSIVAIVLLSLLVVVFGGFGVWSFMNYIEQKTDVDTKIRNAESSARNEQSKIEADKYIVREKEPKRG